MNIVIVAKNPFYYKNRDCYLAGHVVGFVYPFINFLLKHNHKIVLISPSQKPDRLITRYTSLFPRSPKSKIFHHIFIEPKELPKVPFIFAGLDVEAAILESKALLKKIDIVLSVYVFPWIVPINHLKEKLQYKTVAFLRGTDAIKGCDPRSDYGKIYGVKKWENITKVFRMALKESDLIFATSDWLKRFAEILGISVHGVTPTPPFERAKKIRDLPLGSARLKKRFLKNEIIKKQLKSIDPMKPWFIYLGRFDGEKHVDIAIKAFSKSKNYIRSYLILGGSGQDFYSLKKLTRKLALKNVKFCFIPPDSVPLFCKCATAMIQPSFIDAQPSFIDARPHSVTNASYVGCPVIIPFVKNRYDFGGAHESLSKLNIERLSYSPFLSRDKVIKNIAKKMDLLLENRQLINDIREANKKWSSKFEAEKEFSRIEKELLKTKRYQG